MTTPTSITPEIRKTLVLARDLLVRDGWQQRRSGPQNHKERGCRCLLGAALAACNATGANFSAVWPLLEAKINEKLPAPTATNWPEGYLSVARWNDQAARSREHVLALLDALI